MDSPLFNNNLSSIKGMTPLRLSRLLKLNITTIYDLISYTPNTYLDMDNKQHFSKTTEGFTITPVKLCSPPHMRYIRKNMNIIDLKVTDGEEIVQCFWFNQPYFMQKKLPLDEQYVVIGKIQSLNGKKRMVNPQLVTLEKCEKGIVPIYSLTKGLNQKTLRLLMKNALTAIKDTVDYYTPAILQELDVMCFFEAYTAIHFPNTLEQVELAKKRLKIDEIMLFQIAIDLINHKSKLCAPIISECNADEFINALDFKLTDDQKTSINEIQSDMKKAIPMNRLLQGDVGCGKTIVAIFAMYQCVKSGYQCSLMAPTEILATQNFSAVKKLLSKFNITCEILTGSTTKKSRQEILSKLKTGKIQVLVGTHAIIQPDIEFLKIGLVITDEQHRFGVKQRAKISNNNAHTLIMSATPIPRTLALIAFGELDISIIKTMPAGRKPIDTFIIPPHKRLEMYCFLKKECQSGKQGYIVCPLIDESENFDIQSATSLYKELSGSVLKSLKIGLLHGKLKSDDKNKLMVAFKNGDLDVLVSTTVIEVGVNVPNASVMIIENAQMFGLSTLHQLRGRVGRGKTKSYCFLYTTSATSVDRLTVLKNTQNGYDIAKQDVINRGIGNFLGFSQHGKDLFTYTNIYLDFLLIKDIKSFVHTLSKKNSETYTTLENISKSIYKDVLDDIILN